MALEFALPDVGEGIDAGEIIAWHVAVGDSVEEDQPLVDVQTDKAIVTIPCPATGTVLELRGEPGDTVPVGATLAVFTTGRTLASPAVRRLARQAGLRPEEIDGSGPGGRIIREDVQAAVAARAPAPPGPEAAPVAAEAEVVPLRGTRRAIAHSLTRSWQTIPHMTDYREVDAGALIDTQRALRRRAERRGDEALARAMTVTPLIVKMLAAALPRHRFANASIDLEREEITLHGQCDVGVAVAAPQGLVVPVVHHADSKSAVEIALEVAELARAARKNRLAPEQLAGGTITVNNYGALGVWLGTPIITPGQVVNLGVGKLEERPVVRGGEIVARPILPLAVSGDHRVLDGHTLAALVSDVVELIEDPSLLAGELR